MSDRLGVFTEWRELWLVVKTRVLSDWVAFSTSRFWTCTTAVPQISRLRIWGGAKYLRVIEFFISRFEHLEIHLSWLTVWSRPVQVIWVILIALATRKVYLFVWLSIPKLILDMNVHSLAACILVVYICEIQWLCAFTNRSPRYCSSCDRKLLAWLSVLEFNFSYVASLSKGFWSPLHSGHAAQILTD